MKKLLTLIFALVMAFTLCACGGAENTEDTSSNNDASSEAPSETPSTDVSDESSDEPSDDPVEEAAFKVTVVDQDGNPVAGAMVQICLDSCLPAMTDANGVAAFNTEIVEGHKLSVTVCPEGYTYEGEAEIYLEAGATEYTLELVKGN